MLIVEGEIAQCSAQRSESTMPRGCRFWGQSWGRALFFSPDFYAVLGSIVNLCDHVSLSAFFLFLSFMDPQDL